jgi:hypothetical protein
MEAANAQAAADERRDTRLEILIAVGLGLSAILTALCVYLTDVHDDEAQVAFNEGVRGVTEATGGYVNASQQRAADEAVFLEFAQQANAAALGGDRLAGITSQYIKEGLMRPELQAALEWWAQENEGRRAADALPSPFVPENPAYEEPLLVEAEAQTESANAAFAEAQDEQKEGDTYIIAGVIVATALFLYGIAGVTRNVRLKLVMTTLGYIVFLVSLGVVLFG